MQRRSFMKGTLALAAVGLLNPVLFRHGLAAEEGIEMPYKDLIEEYLGGKKAEDGSKIINLNIPDAPENGAVVPVEVTIDYPMDADNYIKNITVLSTKNKANKAISFDLTPASGLAYLYVNVKLGQTQDVVVLAQTNKGKIFQSSKNIRIALGGCGG